MRNLIPILLAVVVLSSGCDPDGYSCNSDGCYEDNDNPQYQTLEDCNNMCDEQIPGGCGSPVLHEGYLYSTVQIGGQCWFAENCRYLPEVSPSSEGSAEDAYYYVYDYEGTDVEDAIATDNYETYGVLYNYPAVMTADVCPSGWHIPSDAEFTELTDFLGGEVVAGGKMKEAGYDHWNSPNNGATNSSGWTGLPGGHRFAGGGGGVISIGYVGSWWVASDLDSIIWVRFLDYDEGYVEIDGTINGGYSGHSARCIRD